MESTGEEVCEMLNACFSQSPIDPAWPTRPSTSLASHTAVKDDKTKTESLRNWRFKRSANQRAGGTIKIAHITDVHLELDYTEVSIRDVVE